MSKFIEKLTNVTVIASDLMLLGYCAFLTYWVGKVIGSKIAEKIKDRNEVSKENTQDNNPE